MWGHLIAAGRPGDVGLEQLHIETTKRSKELEQGTLEKSSFRSTSFSVFAIQEQGLIIPSFFKRALVRRWREIRILVVMPQTQDVTISRYSTQADPRC